LLLLYVINFVNLLNKQPLENLPPNLHTLVIGRRFANSLKRLPLSLEYLTIPKSFSGPVPRTIPHVKKVREKQNAVLAF